MKASLKNNRYQFCLCAVDVARIQHIRTPEMPSSSERLREANIKIGYPNPPTSRQINYEKNMSKFGSWARGEKLFFGRF
jgi:hypothetical protein